MSDQTRRAFFGSSGLAAIGIGMNLRQGALPTESSGADDIPTPFDVPLRMPQDQQGKQKKLKPTEKDIEGPYFRAGAPYRAKVTPPLAMAT